MENNKPLYAGDTYGFEIPPEVLESWRRSGKSRKPIPESKVADLTCADITKSPYRFLKRGLDIVISALGLVILAVPMLLVALAIVITDPGRVIFSQYRIGMGGRRFRVYKFRTMRAETPKYMATNDVHNPDEWITPVGRILRKTSLDELPQLVNVLIGDMSLIGPRPLIADEVPIHCMRMRFGVYRARPGITGLAQINGRDTVSAANKVRFDVKYINNYSFEQDLRILASTFPRVFGGAGVVEGGVKRKK